VNRGKAPPNGAFSCFRRWRKSQGHGLDLCIERGWPWLHESGTYVKFTQAGVDLFA
jgi:hypothetical protein